jgi:hypothetical protein
MIARRLDLPPFAARRARLITLAATRSRGAPPATSRRSSCFVAFVGASVLHRVLGRNRSDRVTSDRLDVVSAAPTTPALES